MHLLMRTVVPREDVWFGQGECNSLGRVFETSNEWQFVRISYVWAMRLYKYLMIQAHGGWRHGSRGCAGKRAGKNKWL